jgi:hypothetical protein
MKYLAMAPKLNSSGPAAAAGATFDMEGDESPAAYTPTEERPFDMDDAACGGSELETLQKENAELKARNAELEKKVAELERSSNFSTYASLPSSSSIAQKVEESRKARQRLAALLNLDEN